MACFACFSKKKKPQNHGQIPSINAIQIHQIQQASQVSMNNNQINQQSPAQLNSFSNLAEFFQYALNHQSSFMVSQSFAPIEDKVKINTIFQLDDIEGIDGAYTADQKQKFKYYCPICLRYFKQILETKCCQNYICHFCADSLNKKYCSVDYPSRCHICNHENLELIDIQPNQEIRVYTDGIAKSQNNSFILKNDNLLLTKSEEEEKKNDNFSQSACFKYQNSLVEIQEQHQSYNEEQYLSQNEEQQSSQNEEQQNEQYYQSQNKEQYYQSQNEEQSYQSQNEEQENSNVSFEDLPSPNLSEI